MKRVSLFGLSGRMLDKLQEKAVTGGRLSPGICRGGNHV